MTENNVKPLIAGETGSKSESVQTVLQRLDKKIIISDYQRDSDQWDRDKKSLFIESILNNLTVPPIFLCPIEDGKSEVVDGQQRLTTLQQFFRGQLTLEPSTSASYLGETCVHYAGKKYSDIPEIFREAFQEYLLTMITLPHGLSRQLRLEIFRRINQAGTPLSPQDIRLATYGDCETVAFIRLCGIYDEKRQGSERMIKIAKEKYSLDWPWGLNEEDCRIEWQNWWDGKEMALGQTSSEMFLWFFIAKYVSQIDEILMDSKYLSSQLNISFYGSSDEVGDITCAQLENESKTKIKKLGDLIKVKELFEEFSRWFYFLRVNIPADTIFNVSKYRRIAFLIGGLSNVNHSLHFSPKQLNKVTSLMKEPRKAKEEFGIDIPEAKGRWAGSAGIKAQIQSYIKVAERIKEL